MSRGPYPMLLMLAMSLPGAVRALGLGDIRVESALNEPLSAQIDILGATRDELAALTASVANREIFQRYGADRPAFLSTATFKVGLDGQGRPVLNVRSAAAFTDPLVSFVVDLRWGKNEVVREYSLLLDPPGYGAPRTPDVQLAASPAPAASQPGSARPAGAQPASTAQATPTPRTHQAVSLRAISHQAVAHQPAARPPMALQPGASRVYKVAAGDTLRAVARHAGARSEAHAQRMMIAIFRANPGAFEGNINRLHRDALLTLPSDAELESISGVDAKREVRAHMTAWRLDGRPNAPHRTVAEKTAPAAAPALVAPAASTVAAAAAPAAVATPTDAEATDAELKARVANLEHSLNDMHQQLATENAKLQSLKDVVTQPEAPSAELVHNPIISSARADSSSRPVVAKGSATAPADKGAWLAPVVLSAGILMGAFAYFRKRRVVPPNNSNAPRLVPVESDSKALAVQAPLPERSPNFSAPVVTQRNADPIDPAFAAALFDLPEMPPDTVKQPAITVEPIVDTAKTTVSLEIDIEALERSYLESLPIETAGFDTAIGAADLDTVVTDTRQIPPAIDSTNLDFNLAPDLDDDGTVQHVHMPSGLHERPAADAIERRTNIVDALKMAIEKDPGRSDLRMKLLETYYSAAATNQRAFIDVVRKLSREPASLSQEDWDRVNMMGRQIAGDDILFAGVSKNDDLADCA